MAPKRKKPRNRREKTNSEEEKAKQVTPEEAKPESKLLTKMKSVMDSVQKGYTHQAKNIGRNLELLLNIFHCKM